MPQNKNPYYQEAVAEIAKIDIEIARLHKTKGPFRQIMTNISVGQLQTYAADNGLKFADLCHGTWECEDSPSGACIYDVEHDHMLDCCLVCGDPDERK